MNPAPSDNFCHVQFTLLPLCLQQRSVCSLQTPTFWRNCLIFICFFLAVIGDVADRQLHQGSALSDVHRLQQLSLKSLPLLQDSQPKCQLGDRPEGGSQGAPQARWWPLLPMVLASPLPSWLGRAQMCQGQLRIIKLE